MFVCFEIWNYRFDKDRTERWETVLSKCRADLGLELPYALRNSEDEIYRLDFRVQLQSV